MNPAYIHGFVYTGIVGVAAMVAYSLHETAHYLAAVISGVRAESVIVGFGPEIWHRRGRNGTRWSLRLLPLCGRVHLRAHSLTEARDGPRTHLFTQIPALRQIAIIVAGPAGNFVTAFVALALYFTACGLPSVPPVVAGVRLGGPAAQAGMRPGDEIVALDGRPVMRLEDVTRAMVAGRPMRLSVRRGAETLPVTVTPAVARWTDARGAPQAHVQAGMLAANAPFSLAQIDAIDGVAVKDDADKGITDRARRLLLAKLGGTAVIAAHVNDRQAHDYLVDVPRAENRALGQPAPVQGLSLSPSRDNFYDAVGPVAAAREAAYETGRLTGGFFHIFFHTYPFDTARIKPQVTVPDHLAPGRAVAYVFAHKVAEWSICLAILNLAPVPGTDGWFILYIAAGAVATRRRAPRLRLRLIQLTLTGLLVVWSLINLPAILNGLG